MFKVCLQSFLYTREQHVLHIRKYLIASISLVYTWSKRNLILMRLKQKTFYYEFTHHSPTYSVIQLLSQTNIGMFTKVMADSLEFDVPLKYKDVYNKDMCRYICVVEIIILNTFLNPCLVVGRYTSPT